MHFTLQMMAVIQAIWILRTTPSENEELKGQGPTPSSAVGSLGVKKLNHSQVEAVACDILKRQAAPNTTPLVVRRQSWYGANAKDEWKAIRRAIDGEKPLSNHVAVEKEIAKFDDVDGAGALKAEINELLAKVAIQERIIAGHREEMEQFKAKAYLKQYVNKSDIYDYDAIERQHRAAQSKLKREESLREKYQQENRGLVAKVAELEKIAKAKGPVGGYAKPIYKLFSPDLGSINPSDPNTMMGDYAELKAEAWEELKEAANRKPPIDIYLVFHKFNIDPTSFVTERLPLVQGVLSYVFAGYEPSAGRRKRMYEEAARIAQTPPVVFLVEDSPSPQGNVVHIADGRRSIAEQLHSHVVTKRRGVDYYDPIAEGFTQIWIERIR